MKYQAALKRVSLSLLVLTAWAVLLAPAGRAAVTRIEILEKLPYAGGRAFEGIGSYERLIGRIYFAVDPEAAANSGVIDLPLAPRNEAGLVEFTADVEILAPVDRSKASGTLFYDVNNRGHRLAHRVFDEEADDFLARQGLVVVWSGWLAEVLPERDDYVETGDLLRLDAPVASNAGRPISGRVRYEMVTNVPVERMNLTTRAQLGAYPPADDKLDGATLTWRLRETDERVVIPREQWRLEVTNVSSPSHKYCPPKVELVVAGGLKPGYIYEVIYEARDPIVQGLGLAGIRDLISFLKYETSGANPLAVAGRSATPHAVGFGISQSGRCLRVMLHEGFNADERGRIVFDGMIPHVSGAGLGFFNHRFASPSAFGGQHDEHLFPCDMFPFAYERDRDPLSGKEEGLLDRARAARVVPKIMHIQNSAEYWHRAGSLVHTDPLSQRDAPIPPEVRIYSVGGAQHSWGNDLSARPPFYGTLINNPTDYRPHLRAMLVALIDWVKNGTEPPASVYPRIDNQTLAPWSAARCGWQALPGIRFPEVIQQPELLDFGPDFAEQRILSYHPPRQLKKYPVLVPAVDVNNNDRGMVQLPFLRVPIGTYTGWNLRDGAIGGEHELLMLKGGFIPFTRTKAERLAIGDPRLSLEERYGDAETYLRKLSAAIDALVAERHLLAEDAPRYLQRGRKLAEVFNAPAAKESP